MESAPSSEHRHPYLSTSSSVADRVRPTFVPRDRRVASTSLKPCPLMMLTSLLYDSHIEVILPDFCTEYWAALMCDLEALAGLPQAQRPTTRKESRTKAELRDKSCTYRHEKVSGPHAALPGLCFPRHLLLLCAAVVALCLCSRGQLRIATLSCYTQNERLLSC